MLQLSEKWINKFAACSTGHSITSKECTAFTVPSQVSKCRTHSRLLLLFLQAKGYFQLDRCAITANICKRIVRLRLPVNLYCAYSRKSAAFRHLRFLLVETRLSTGGFSVFRVYVTYACPAEHVLWLALVSFFRAHASTEPTTELSWHLVPALLLPPTCQSSLNYGSPQNPPWCRQGFVIPTTDSPIFNP